MPGLLSPFKPFTSNAIFFKNKKTEVQLILHIGIQ